MKAVKKGLWSIWLSGFALIGLSFYSTQRLPPLMDQIAESTLSQKDLRDLGNPKITIFSAPRPFVGSAADRQSLAVLSWLGLSSRIQVVLFSKHPSVFSFSEAFGSRVLVEPNIDFTFLGTLFFHSMMARAYSFKSDISVLVHPEAMLFPDFISTLNYAHELDHDWLLVALSRNLSRFPFRLDEDGKHWRREDGRLIRSREKLQDIIHSESWQQTPCEGKKLMAWNNNGDLPLHSVVLPPFLYGRGVHDNWVINAALSSAFRFVFDASLAISSFYLDDKEHKSYRVLGSSNENRSWEYDGNSQLGMAYGSLFYQKSNYSDLAKLLKCDGKYIFVDTKEKPILGKGRILRSWWKNKRSACINSFKPLNRILDCSLTDQIKPPESLGFRFSLESLLPLLADKNKTIVLAVAGYSYKDMLMSWVCRLRRLQITNFIVCALDDETYNFSILQGLPVFKDLLAPRDISFHDCHFGTKCFQRVTKVKSRMVLKILKLGYNVLLSDVDVYWFKNPLPFLSSFGPSVLLAQSDEYNETGPINIPRRLNSGFYFAQSDGSTIAALEKVVKHAANSGLSEQPSFYDTLCGENGSNRVGDNRCIEPETNLTVHFLDRNCFPNGAYQGLWQRKNARAACKKKGCFVIHNNWISGRQKKLERQLLTAMLKKCAKLLGLVGDVNGEPKRKKEIKGSPFPDTESRGGDFMSLNMSLKSKRSFVRIVHSGGTEELYPYAIQWMEKYPGTCVARAEVFKDPHKSLLWPEERLFAGEKYLIIPSSTVKKLQQKNPEKAHGRGSNEGEEEIWDDISMDQGEVNFEETDFAAKEFYAPKIKSPRSLTVKGIRKKKTFVPPLPKARSYKGPEWEPSLTSVQEVSP